MLTSFWIKMDYWRLVGIWHNWMSFDDSYPLIIPKTCIVAHWTRLKGNRLWINNKGNLRLVSVHFWFLLMNSLAWKLVESNFVFSNPSKETKETELPSSDHFCTLTWESSVCSVDSPGLQQDVSHLNLAGHYGSCPTLTGLRMQSSGLMMSEHCKIVRWVHTNSTCENNSSQKSYWTSWGWSNC